MRSATVPRLGLTIVYRQEPRFMTPRPDRYPQVARLLTATPRGPAHPGFTGFLRVREGQDLARIDRPRQMGARGPQAPASLDLYGQSSTEKHDDPPTWRSFEDRRTVCLKLSRKGETLVRKIAPIVQGVEAMLGEQDIDRFL